MSEPIKGNEPGPYGNEPEPLHIVVLYETTMLDLGKPNRKALYREWFKQEEEAERFYRELLDKVELDLYEGNFEIIMATGHLDEDRRPEYFPCDIDRRAVFTLKKSGLRIHSFREIK